MVCVKVLVFPFGVPIRELLDNDSVALTIKLMQKG